MNRSTSATTVSTGTETTKKKKHGEVDFSSGSCDNNGYSKCPPLFTCNGWASGNGIIYDNIHKNI